ncbi:MAG: dTDP-4-dehydrorhamnose 3,5-epimerase [Candidatus Eremiobacteraeota bacterium]|nr:dTDP-4-dehydrorhamnose 3,5-epimerase [Candidatus Eremiobacteraeota bacterium]
MHIEPLAIADAKILTLRAFGDERGYFKETYSEPRYREAGIEDRFVQDNVSVSRRNVLRGLHAEPSTAKLVQVLAGEAFDVIADIRDGSPTYGQWYGTVLHAREHRQVYVPRGCLHGFLALTDEVMFLYKQTAAYNPQTEFGIAWDDPQLAIAWPLDGIAPLLSAKDRANPRLSERSRP